MNRFGLITSTFCCLASLASAQEFLGVFTTPFVPGCTIERGGSYVGSSYYGIARSGGEFGSGLVDEAASKVFELDSQLEDQAKAAGYNAVIDFEIRVDHSNDAVFESGTNWNSGGKPFDFSGTYIALGTGTPVQVKCP